MKKILIICLFLFSCERVKEQDICISTYCINGYEEEYLTNGKPIPTMQGTSQRKETRWVCTEYKTDTIICDRHYWRLKK